MFGSSGTPGRANSFPLDDDRSANATIPESSLRESGSAMAAALHHSGAGGSGSRSGSPTDEKGNGSASGNNTNNNGAPDSPAGAATEKRRRSSGIAKMGGIFSSAKNSLHLGQGSNSTDKLAQSPMQRLSKQDPALGVPQGSNNNSAGESVPGPKSTFRVGVTEDKNKKCRRTMEDTHAYLYNFLSTPSPALGVVSDTGSSSKGRPSNDSGRVSDHSGDKVVETDNGYFAIFDGHAGTFAADWCGKKLHLILEDTIRQNPNTPIPELLDQTFTLVDQQLEKLPLKNSGCTAVIAVLRWEDRVPNNQSATGSALLAPAAAAAVAAKPEPDASTGSISNNTTVPTTADTTTNASLTSDSSPELRLKESATRQRVLYTANVGDARVVLCRSGRALRLSYDHKGSDENEGRRVANAGGLILNNRVNGVLAVTRALGDAYMKDLVTGHPYTTETVIQPEQDEFLILACDGLWDVCSDQEAVDLVRHDHDPQVGSKKLVEHALARFSTDNLSCMIVRFDNRGIQKLRAEHNIGVEGDKHTAPGGVTEADAIVAETKRLLEETGHPPGHGPPAARASDPMIVEQPEEEQRAADAPVGAPVPGQEPGPELNADVLKKAQLKAKEGQLASPTS